MKQPSDFINDSHTKASRLLITVTWLLLLVSGLLSPWYSTWIEWLVIGVPAAAIPTLLFRISPYSRATRVSVGLSYMVFAALMIHQAHGLIEMHFAIFGLLAFLLYFKDWAPVVGAAGLIAVHHLSFNYLQAGGAEVYVFSSGTGLDVVILHATFVIVESAILIYLSLQADTELRETAEIKTVAQYMTTKNNRINLQFESRNLDSDSGKHFKVYFDTLKAAMISVDSGAISVSQSSAEIAEGNTSLAERIEEQGNSMLSVASSVKQITAAVEHNTSYTGKVNTLATHAATEAQGGVNVVHQAIDAMGDITRSSSRIAEIITTIDEIAFQTNLLAINASIEAAHAGDQGKGFAVVASEVRILAQRCADSAKETKTLIEDSLEKVKRGSGLVDEAGASLNNISSSVQELSGLVEEIDREGQTQQSGIQQINAAMQSINDLSGQNNALVEEIATASQVLKNQAHDLKQVINQFEVGAQDTLEPAQQFSNNNNSSNDEEFETFSSHDAQASYHS